MIRDVERDDLSIEDDGSVVARDDKKLHAIQPPSSAWVMKRDSSHQRPTLKKA
jgi:hypothetical protein